MTEKNKRITIHCVSKNRQFPLYGMLESLRHQTYQNFDMLLIDDCSNLPYSQTEHIAFITNRMRIEGHGVKLIRNDIPKGVCGARNFAIDNDTFNNNYILRLDDDILLDSEYIEKLMKVIDKGYDIASGVTPHAGYPDFVREVKYVLPIINKIETLEDGSLKIGDECGFQYYSEAIIPTPHFRSCALYKKKINIRYQTNLSFSGFREELFFSLQAILNGYTIGVNTSAIAWHAQASSGGCRTPKYRENVRNDEELFKKWFKIISSENPQFLEDYYNEVKIKW